MSAFATTKPGAERVRSLRHDVTRPLPLAGGAFDCVLCCLVAEHIPDLAALFRELGRVCKPAPLADALPVEGRAPLSRLSPSSRPGSARPRCASGPGDRMAPRVSSRTMLLLDQEQQRQRHRGGGGEARQVASPPSCPEFR
ncbi:MAG: hypothetical protein DMD83_19260 [Candidatus Rokuibacteriota bacterium]|nr:MAG: hypothetical protein DMD83_19260 [Candidatus Rokubacteria bacterium]